MMYRKMLIIVSCTIGTCASHGVFTTYKLLRMNNQHVYLFGDIHNDSAYQKNTEKHAHEVLAFIESLPRNKTIVFAEDVIALLHDYNTPLLIPVYPIAKGIPILRYLSPLLGMTGKCRRLGIQVMNVECRMIDTARNKRLSDVERWRHAYPDSPLSPYYEKIISGNYNVDDCKKTEINLVDVAVIHNIYFSRNNDHFVVLVGNSHAKNIYSMLTKLGYCTLYEHGLDILKIRTILHSPYHPKNTLFGKKESKEEHKNRVFDDRIKRVMISFDQINKTKPAIFSQK